MTVVDDRGVLADAAGRFVAEHFGPAGVRRAREHGSDGFASAWAAMVQLGWAGALVGDEHGGAGAAVPDLVPLLAACGAGVAASPLIGTGVVAAALFGRGADDGVRGADAVLAGIVGGAIVGVGLGTPDPARPSAQVHRDPSALAGRADVLHAPLASWLLVRAAEPGGGASVVAVPAAAPGVSIRAGVMVDGNPVGLVRFDAVAPDDVLVLAERIDPSAGLLELAGPAALAAHAVVLAGGMRRALDITVEHLRDRQQFGVPIGAFQALQHRAADLHAATRLADALVLRAVREHPRRGGDGRRAQLAHAAVARAAETYEAVAADGVQLHGGMGMTDEAEIGFHLEAARTGATVHGTPAHHRSRYAHLRGY